MSKPKPAAPRAEFFVGDVPPPIVKQVKKAIEEPAATDDSIDLPRNKQLVVAHDVPMEDDPGALLRQLTAGMPPGAMRPDEIADEANRARHNAHIDLLRMTDAEQRRQRRAKLAEERGKQKRKR